MDTLKKNPDNSVTLTISIPWKTVATAYDATVDDMVKEAEIDGFRKGKAPRATVEERLDKSVVYEEVLKRIIPDAYQKAVKDHDLKPIVLPNVKLKKAKENEDWEVEATTCEKPIVTLGKYKEAIRDLKAGKLKKIWVPGQAEAPEDKDAKKAPSLDELLKTLADNITITVPDILIEQEVTRLLSDLIDQTKKIGLTVEQYLSSTGRTAETLRTEYRNQATINLQLEFALEAVAEAEAVTVSDADLAKILEKAGTPEERNALEQQKYYLSSVIRRQKTLEFLASL
jgi:FKBP-type peptidyl-prolyl cis-trans isomerase (trigger factor)